MQTILGYNNVKPNAPQTTQQPGQPLQDENRFSRVQQYPYTIGSISHHSQHEHYRR